MCSLWDVTETSESKKGETQFPGTLPPKTNAGYSCPIKKKKLSERCTFIMRLIQACYKNVKFSTPRSNSHWQFGVNSTRLFSFDVKAAFVKSDNGTAHT